MAESQTTFDTWLDGLSVPSNFKADIRGVLSASTKVKAGVTALFALGTWTGLISQEEGKEASPELIAISNHSGNLDTDNIQRRSSGNAIDHSMADETRRLQIIGRLVGEELPLWKQYHSIYPTIEGDCKKIFDALVQQRTLDERLRIMSNSLQTQPPEFFRRVEEFEVRGYLPLLNAIRHILVTFQSDPKVKDSLDWMKDVRQSRAAPDKWLDNVNTVHGWLRNLESACILPDRDSQPNVAAIMSLFKERVNALAANLSFSVAFLMCVELFDLNSIAPEVKNDLRRQETRLVQFMRSELANLKVAGVVNKSNDVIFHWLDVMSESSRGRG